MSKKPKIDYVLVIGIACVCLLLLASIHFIKGGINKPRIETTHIDTSIVRLHDMETGRFFCSGVVISDSLILTAAHCVVRENPLSMLFGPDIVRRVEIRSINGQPLGIYADLAAANPRQDVALLSGSFSEFDHMNVEVKPQAIEDSFLHSKHLKACGYPAGGKLVCSTITSVRHMNFGFGANGFLYPGMSGGPVIDEETGNVIGLNTAVDGERVYLSPTEELFNQLRP